MSKPPSSYSNQFTIQRYRPRISAQPASIFQLRFRGMLPSSRSQTTVRRCPSDATLPHRFSPQPCDLYRARALIRPNDEWESCFEGYIRDQTGNSVQGVRVTLNQGYITTQGHTDVVPLYVPGAVVGAVVFNDPNAVEDHPINDHEAVTDGTGHYSFKNLAPGSYSFWVSPTKKIYDFPFWVKTVANKKLAQKYSFPSDHAHVIVTGGQKTQIPDVVLAPHTPRGMPSAPPPAIPTAARPPETPAATPPQALITGPPTPSPQIQPSAGPSQDPLCNIPTAMGPPHCYFFNSSTMSRAPTRNASRQKITINSMFGPGAFTGTSAGICGALTGAMLTCGICI